MTPALTPVPVPILPEAIPSACAPVMDDPSATAVVSNIPVSAVPRDSKGETAPSDPISDISMPPSVASSPASAIPTSGANSPAEPMIATLLNPIITGTSHDEVKPLPRVSSLGSSTFCCVLPRSTS